MKNFTKRHDELFYDVLNAFDDVNPISFKYEGDYIYELPRMSAVDKYNIYTEYAIIEFQKEYLVAVPLDDLDEKRTFDFHTLTLPECIDLYEFIQQYIIQSN